MKKKNVLPVAVLSSALFVGAFAPIQAHAVQPEQTPQVSTQSMAEKFEKSKGNKPIFVVEKQAEKQNASNAAAAVNHLKKNQEKYKIKNPKSNFKPGQVKKDDLGMTHVNLQQTKNGVPVEGSEVIVHYDEENTVQSVSGHFNHEVEEADISTEPTLSKTEALNKAKNEVDAPEEMSYTPTSELVIYPYNDASQLAYKVNVNFLGKDPGNWFVFVDAKSGQVIDKYNALMHANGFRSATASGLGVLGDHRKLHITHKNDKTDNLKGTQFYLYDNSHDNLDGIYTYDMKNQWGGEDFQLPGVLYSNNSASFKDDYDRAAVDAHYNSEQVYDYFLEEHDRNSLDGEGMAIKSSVHYGQDYNNAFWNGEQMTYGDGDGEFFISLSAGLDVAAHEMTHGVTSNSANLQYRFQSGALNEAFSDIFGALVDEEDWEIGEDIMGEDARQSGRTSLRSLSNPDKYAVGAEYVSYGDGSGMYPTHMDEYYDLPLSLDNGGVHINSSIINHAAYLTGEQIGKDKLGQIYYRALTVYLTPTSDFSHARQALIQSAVDIYGEGSTEAEATESGLNQVGITE
ncbi:M4 family metallopeptidase [Halobacillus shinanisalinarum]|uniref:Neutral metalloproteinase n=1 Tax=Halobacillus shinanisalinarum TaxID=2932258 RepID=A0ABY4GXQ1_9BACI|nr:M4 family metallopeptidase [Halobacillus shinanisalinarum]UOQ92966.1 M4 family metallopeptidase [Halobacillus shinanisalinarum]